MARINIEKGTRYNFLVYLGFNEEVSKIKNQSYGNCLCDCGNEKVLSHNSVRSGSTKSCGCYNKKMTTTHGMTKSSEYKSWGLMKSRCYNPKDKRYSHYGGRGIKICDRWLNSFENFLEDMGKKPNNKYTLDRIDVNGNYEPLNCKWSTRIEQANNKTTNRFVMYKGDKITVAECARKTGINVHTLHSRVYHGSKFLGEGITDFK